jgi:hypothetical protein
MAAAVRPPKEIEDKIKQEGADLGFPALGGEKVMPWDYFKKANAIIAKYTQTHSEKGIARFA